MDSCHYKVLHKQRLEWLRVINHQKAPKGLVTAALQCLDGKDRGYTQWPACVQGKSVVLRQKPFTGNPVRAHQIIDTSTASIQSKQFT